MLAQGLVRCPRVFSAGLPVASFRPDDLTCAFQCPRVSIALGVFYFLLSLYPPLF